MFCPATIVYEVPRLREVKPSLPHEEPFLDPSAGRVWVRSLDKPFHLLSQFNLARTAQPVGQPWQGRQVKELPFPYCLSYSEPIIADPYLSTPCANTNPVPASLEIAFRDTERVPVLLAKIRYHSIFPLSNHH